MFTNDRWVTWNKIKCLFKTRRQIANRQLKYMAFKEFNSLPKDITQKLTHGEFKKEFYDFELRSYKESSLNFASSMSWNALLPRPA